MNIRDEIKMHDIVEYKGMKYVITNAINQDDKENMVVEFVLFRKSKHWSNSKITYTMQGEEIEKLTIIQ